MEKPTNRDCGHTPILSKFISHAGFTLPEALTTLSVLSVLVTGVIPGMNDMVQNNRITSSTNEFIAHLYLSRSEAVKTGNNVIMCPSNDGVACNKTSLWHSGWIVFQELT